MKPQKQPWTEADKQMRLWILRRKIKRKEADIRATEKRIAEVERAIAEMEAARDA